MEPRMEEFYLNKFGLRTPTPKELEAKAILTLINIDPVIDGPQPLPPNVIPVAGLHIKPPKPLPSDIESFMNASRNGVILVSFGTNFRSELMALDKRNIIIEVMREMTDYHFLWKYEGDLPASTIPPNVLIRKWLPQSDILANENLKLFFTHSGKLSTQEATWRGIPMLCMLFALDQNQVNMDEMIEMKW